MRFTRNIFTASFAVCLLSAPIVFAQSPEPAFTKAREERDQSIRAADAATYDKYTTDKFIVVDQNGNVRNLSDQNARFQAQGFHARRRGGRGLAATDGLGVKRVRETPDRHDDGGAEPEPLGHWKRTSLGSVVPW